MQKLQGLMTPTSSLNADELALEVWACHACKGKDTLQSKAGIVKHNREPA